MAFNNSPFICGKFSQEIVLTGRNFYSTYSTYQVSSLVRDKIINDNITLLFFLHPHKKHKPF